VGAVLDGQRRSQTDWVPSLLRPASGPIELPHLKYVATSPGGRFRFRWLSPTIRGALSGGHGGPEDELGP